MTYFEYMVTAFAITIGVSFALLIAYVIILLINRAIERYEDKGNGMDQKLLDMINNFGEE